MYSLIMNNHICLTVGNLNVKLFKLQCFSWIMNSHQCFQSLAAWLSYRLLLPCLPPSSTLQVDVNGDAERPPGRSCVQDHAHSYLSHLPAQSMFSRLTSSSLSGSQISFCQQLRHHLESPTDSSAVQWLPGPDCSLFTRELPVVYQASKVSATTPSVLVCVSIETTTGKAGRMLMASQWASEAQLHAAVCHGKTESLLDC